jgi:3-dehydroquinate dehydratase-1
MNTVTVRGLTLGTGRPKIIIPLVGKTQEEILAQAAALHTLPVDMVEWRIDWFQDVHKEAALLAALDALRKELGELPLLVTFRTAAEGGAAAAIPFEDYARLCTTVAATGQADLVDVEAFSATPEEVSALIATLHGHGVKVIASNHDFHATPAEAELIARLCQMQALGADIPKIAVMPQDRGDVMTLLCATEAFSRLYADRPIITMSMGALGVISRLGGQCFGSCATFGSAGQSSAPGQVEVGQLSALLEQLDKVL